MNKTSRAIIGFAVAPFVPPSLFLAAISLPSSGHVHWSDLWGAAVAVFEVSMLITVPITLVVGLPVYLAIERHRDLRLQHVLLTSGVAGAAAGLLLTAPHIGALLGLSAGITFWLIWHRARDARPF
jgi:hypothetical protein